jgi:hypothetical protein
MFKKGYIRTPKTKGITTPVYSFGVVRTGRSILAYP